MIPSSYLRYKKGRSGFELAPLPPPHPSPPSPLFVATPLIETVMKKFIQNVHYNYPVKRVKLQTLEETMNEENYDRLSRQV